MNRSQMHPALLAALDELTHAREALVEEIRRLRDDDESAPPSDEGESG